MRRSEVKRISGETSITGVLELDGQGQAKVATGIGFLDHMLTLFAKHGFFDLTLEAKGDLEVDSHHTIEDCGIVLGQLLAKALGDRSGIRRYGTAFLPMDEALIQVSLDISGRPYLVYDCPVDAPMIGAYDTEMTEEFFRAFAQHAGLTLHIRKISGKNAHHIVEGAFKAIARALCEAVSIDPKIKGVLSTKGMLD